MRLTILRMVPAAAILAGVNLLILAWRKLSKDPGVRSAILAATSPRITSFACLKNAGDRDRGVKPGAGNRPLAVVAFRLTFWL